MRRALRQLLTVMPGVAALLLTGAAQADDPAAGRFLIASRELRDPNFTQTVVFLTRYGRQGAMGFVLNRPSGFELSSVFRPRGVTVSNDPVYTGGPVAREGAYLLLRSARRPKGGEAVAADVYFTGNLEALDEALRESVRPDRLRVFIGYSGWGAGQLDNEIEAGAWHVFAGEPALAFDPKPETLWRRLIRKTDLNVARHSGGLAATARNRRPIRPGVPAAGGGFR